MVLYNLHCQALPRAQADIIESNVYVLSCLHCLLYNALLALLCLAANGIIAWTRLGSLKQFCEISVLLITFCEPSVPFLYVYQTDH